MGTISAAPRVLATLLLAACATTGIGNPPVNALAPEAGGDSTAEAATAAPARAPRPAARSLRDPITAADIARIRAASAYDAVVRLRAHFLGNRGVNSFMRPVQSTRPTVFVDGMEMGTIFELRTIPAGDVLEIRFLSGADAMLRYGDGYMAGIIHVTTKR
jgi:outer membrane cobalamin receptor